MKLNHDAESGPRCEGGAETSQQLVWTMCVQVREGPVTGERNQNTLIKGMVCFNALLRFKAKQMLLFFSRC